MNLNKYLYCMAKTGSPNEDGTQDVFLNQMDKTFLKSKGIPYIPSCKGDGKYSVKISALQALLAM